MSFFENTQGEELQNSLWVEKYRPTKLDNYIVRYLTVKYRKLDLKTEYFSKNKI